ncbi:CAP domain-containing protein [Yoonia sp. F2084L]|uniref:CAP domain-containing protein n=1 Tax=Yoonia sp. F2084L TaxID=2926419 RepID=UPI001FF3ED26|nr:CAP domain-containing protein [Yoonia sp. F2084L]MCK0096363.1 CAP domain-containing protein [Yoonia sp. F2084L]
MRTALSIIALICMVACTTTTTPQTTPAQVSSAPGSTTGFAADLNAFRASQGRGAVQPNAALARAAQAHAEDMARRGYFSHDSPGGPNGDTFVDRARAGGCAMTGGAENIANGQQSEEQVLVAWQNSSGHRRNMLVRGYTQFGLGRSGNIWVLKLAQSC